MHHGISHMVGYVPWIWHLGYPSPGHGTSLPLPLLLISGCHHSRPVQTCSFEDSHRPWYRRLVATTETRTVGDRAVRILLECCLVRNGFANLSHSTNGQGRTMIFSRLPENTFLQRFRRVNSCNVSCDVISRIHLGEPAVKRWR